MEDFELKTSPPVCTIGVTKEAVTFAGDFYYYGPDGFRPVKNHRDRVPIGDFLGMGYLKKRSSKRMVQFLVAGMGLSLLSTLSDKLQWFFFLDTGWLSVLINIALVACGIGLLRYFFSQKRVIEISFLSKRICVDETLLTQEDFATLRTAIKAAKGQ